MGWWSATIMGGDTPLDELASIMDQVLGVEFNAEGEPPEGFIEFHCYHINRKLVSNHYRALINYAAKHLDSNDYCGYIPGQVIAVLLLTVGSHIEDDDKQMLIRCAEADEWLKEDGPNSERAKYIKELINAINAAEPGKPTYLEGRGLLESRDVPTGKHVAPYKGAPIEYMVSNKAHVFIGYFDGFLAGRMRVGSEKLPDGRVLSGTTCEYWRHVGLSDKWLAVYETEGADEDV
jgi:hypothetical protein